MSVVLKKQNNTVNSHRGLTVHTAFEKAGPSFFAEFFSGIQNLQFLLNFCFSSSSYFHQRTGDRQNAASRIKEERKFCQSQNFKENK